MSTTEQSENEAPLAEVQQVKSVSKIWFVPIVALFIGAWMIYYQISNQGHEITIYFNSAEGLEAGKTKIRTRFVDVGIVTNIRLRKNRSGVIVTGRINKDEAHLLREDSNLWIVTPKVSLSGVSGLSTILSGPFIELAPGMSGETQTEFEGLEDPPITPAGTPGLHVTLNSNEEFAYGEGDPIIYKGMRVGQVEDIYFNSEERVVYYNAFIESPYHKLITTTTRFWDTSGIRLELGAEGLSVHTGTVETLLTNGVAFGIPGGMGRGDVITKRAYFDIHKSYAVANAKKYKEAAQFVVLVEDSVRGLHPGAPVEYRGLQVGEVLEINMANEQQHQLLEEGYKIPILISVQPGRVYQPDNAEGVETVMAQTLLWVEKGLRATLKMGNIVTGGQYVDLQNYANVTPEELTYFQGHPIIPIISNEFAQLTQKISSILDKVNNLPMADLANNANQTLSNFADLASTFSRTGEHINVLLMDSEQQALVTELRHTLDAFETLANSYATHSDTNRVVNEMMLELQSMMLELKPLINRLNEAPNSLVFPPEDQEQNIYPRAKRN